MGWQKQDPAECRAFRGGQGKMPAQNAGAKCRANGIQAGLTDTENPAGPAGPGGFQLWLSSGSVLETGARCCGNDVNNEALTDPTGAARTLTVSTDPGAWALRTSTQLTHVTLSSSVLG